MPVLSRTIWLSLGLTALFLGAWALPAPAAEQTASPPLQVKEFLRNFTAAVESGDLEAIMALYSDKYMLKGRDKAASRKIWQAALRRNPKPTCRVKLSEFSLQGQTARVGGYLIINGHKVPIVSPLIVKEGGVWRWYGDQKTGKENANLPALKISFASAAWDGRKIPPGQQCRRFGGKGATPPLKVGNIPVQANAIIVEYSDRDWAPMDNGGHGKIGFHLKPGTTQITIPPTPGHTYQLPPGFFLVTEHLGASWDKAGAYMPPCSGGRGNQYYLTVKAVRLKDPQDKQGKTLALGKLEMGSY